MTTIGNIGIGLLVVIVLWLVTLCVFVYSVQIRSNVGWIALVVASVITVTLVVIPTKPKEDKQVDIDILEKDYATIYKQFLLCFLISSALLACILFFFAHCIEPIKASLVKTF